MDTPESAQPEKYIRTFAGDMETVQKGGTPDLAPFKKPEATAEERLVAPSPIIEPAPSEVLPPEPVPPPTPSVPVKPTFSGENLKTYSEDFLNRVKDTQASTATVLAAEQDSTQAPSATLKEKSSHTVLYSVAGVVLLLLGATGVYLALHHSAAPAPAPVVQGPTAPIFVDDREAVAGTGAQLMQAIAASVSQPLASGSARLLYFTSTTTPDSIFTALQTSAPNILVRNINKDGSMAGVVNIGGVQSPFFILSVASYSDTFSGMLSWEAGMRTDLAPLFPPYVVAAPTVATTTLATTTATSTTKAAATKAATKAATSTATSTPPTPIDPLNFVDSTVSNHDVRVYRDASGRSVIVYGYWNQNTLVIARDSSAFVEILNRLATARTD